MDQVNRDVDQLNAALAAMAERAAADPAYRDELKTNQVEALQSAGVSAFSLSGVFAELGAEEEEVAAYGMGLGLERPGGGNPSGIIINGICVGTCRNATIVIDIGCRSSFG